MSFLYRRCLEIFDPPKPQRKLYYILRDYYLAQDYIARGIEQRLIDSGRISKLSKSELAAPPTPSPEAFCHYSAGGWTASTKNPPQRWTRCFTGWCGMG